MKQLTACGIVGAVVAVFAVTPVAAQAPAQVFEQTCAACHSIGGGPRLGPDLSGVTARRDRDWLVRFILNPQAVVDEGDAYATRIVSDAGGLVMPAAAIGADMARALLDYIDAQASGAAAGAPVSARITDRPFSPGDIQAGRQLFAGTQRLTAGGPACLACHHVPGVARLGGGGLGPDLTQVVTRLSGRQGLGAWLQAPPTPVMRGLFGGRRLTPEEIESLLALLEDAASTGGAPSAGRAFLVLGSAGAALGLVLFGWAWRHRFRSMRRHLVDASAAGGSR